MYCMEMYIMYVKDIDIVYYRLERHIVIIPLCGAYRALHHVFSIGKTLQNFVMFLYTLGHRRWHFMIFSCFYWKPIGHYMTYSTLKGLLTLDSFFACSGTLESTLLLFIFESQPLLFLCKGILEGTPVGLLVSSLLSEGIRNIICGTLNTVLWIENKCSLYLHLALKVYKLLHSM